MSKRTHPKKILVVEDDPRIATALSIRLTHAGYHVITASDGHKGLQSAIDLKPDLIISDVWMPGAVGFLVAERLKAFNLGSIPVIFITAHKKKNLTRLAKEVGAAEFFEKPYDPEKLLAAVARALNQTPNIPNGARAEAPAPSVPVWKDPVWQDPVRVHPKRQTRNPKPIPLPKPQRCPCGSTPCRSTQRKT